VKKMKRSKLAVYVPKSKSVWWELIVRGSGIVGIPATVPDNTQIHYEGNIYRFSDVRNYADRIDCAANRLLRNAPTVARAIVQDNDLVFIGWWNHDVGRLTVHNHQPLMEWLDCDSITKEQLLISSKLVW
jgi:hypothetical protein